MKHLIRNLLFSFSMVITVVCSGLVFDVARARNATVDIHKVLASQKSLDRVAKNCGCWR